MRFVAFVNKEPPFTYTAKMGSLVHAKAAEARGDDTRGMLSLETIGHYSDEPGSQQHPFPVKWFYPDTAISTSNSISMAWNSARLSSASLPLGKR